MKKNDLKKIDQNLREKLDKLAKEKFSETANYEFFGSLNILEVERFIELLENNKVDGIPENIKEFVITYLKKLHEKLKEKQEEVSGK